MARALVAAVIAVAVVVVPTDTVANCHEDMPCWNCATMGNGICGPVAGVR